MIGKVIWFDVKKGFGFIKSEDGKDVFAHYSKILAEPGEFRLLEENEQVEFDLVMSDRGDGGQKPQAVNIKRKGGGDEILRENKP